jgi:2-succinyl-6-hydroxy-2,4-cyclohexadiene-1-carboxylate synthase
MLTMPSTTEQIQLHMFTIGNTSLPRIVFLHGFLGSGSDWTPIAGELEKSFCSILVDLPGHGESRIPQDGEPSGFFTKTVDALAAELRRSAAPPCFLVGYSMGGRIGLSLAMRFPELFEKAIIISASPGLRSEDERDLRRKSDEGIARKIEKNFPGFIESWYDQPLFSTLKHHAIFREVEAERMQSDPLNLARALRLLGTGSQPSQWELLSSNHLPLRFFAGEKDAKFVEIGRQMVNLCPCSELEIFPDCGHTLHLENRQLFTDRLNHFFNKHQLS